MPWNYGDILDAVAGAVRPDAPAFIHGERRIPWRQAYARMNNLARALAGRGAVPGHGEERNAARARFLRSKLRHNLA